MIASTDYPIAVFKLREEDGTGFVAFAPDLHGCMSDGESQEEAVANCAQAIKEWIDAAERHGKVVPAPGSAARKQTEAREKLGKELETQKAVFERLDAQIEEVKREIEVVSRRIEETSPWTPDFSFVVAKQSRSEDIVH
jgi:predicted RNase H-like HicB family nuclease